jgi:hypothetical protein
MEHIASTLRAEFNDPENVTFCTLGRGWPIDIWPFQNGMAYLGKDGGGGLGSGPGLSVGAALAACAGAIGVDAGRRRFLHGGDRDFDGGAPSHPAARLVNNNALFQHCSAGNGRPARGTSPTAGSGSARRIRPDIAKLAGLGARVGPVGTAAGQGAISRCRCSNRAVCVIDFHVDPARTLGRDRHRATGG